MIIFLFFLLFWNGLSFQYAYFIFPIISLILLFFTFRKYKGKIALIGLAIFLSGIGISYIKFDYQSPTYSGFVIDSHDNYFLLLSKGERLYVYDKNTTYDIGDYIEVKGEKTKLDFTVLESQFDFNEYLQKKGVNYELEAKNITSKFKAPIRIHQNRKKLLSHFDEETAVVVGKLLFGENDDSSTIDKIDNLHLARLVSMTGVYIYAFLSIIEFFLSFCLKKKYTRLVANLIMIPYYIMTFPRLTIIRIFVVQIFRWINQYPLKGKFSSLDVLGSAGIFLLLIDYHFGYQDSFIIGFTLPAIYRFIQEGTWWFKGVKKKVIEILFAYFFILSFEIKFYNSINPLLLLEYYLFLPIFFIFAIASFLCFCQVPLYSVCKFLLTPINLTSTFLSKINISINMPMFNEWLLFFYILTLLAILYFRSILFIPLYKRLSMGIAIFLLLYALPINNTFSESVTFINVGQGDACLIRKRHSTVLIDTGGLSYMDLAKESLIPYLKKNRIYNIDLVITTHGDFDHMGALDSLRENFYVKQVVTDHSSFPIKMEGVIFNNYNSHISEYSEDNDQSLVVGFHICNKDFLIMGDAPTSVERNIIKEYPNLKCDILKAGHHGSKTSTCEEFVRFLHPKQAIISCGKGNRYGHPHKEVINILKKYNVLIKRTDTEGSISFSNYILM